MGLALTFLYDSRIFLIELSSRFIYLHGLCSAVLDIYFTISLYSYFIPYMIRRVNLVPRYWF